MLNTTAMRGARQNLNRKRIQIASRVAAAQLAHELAHEINNPLEALTNLIYIMKESTAESGECAVMLEEADRQLSRISRLVRNILTLDDPANPTSLTSHKGPSVVTQVLQSGLK